MSSAFIINETELEEIIKRITSGSYENIEKAYTRDREIVSKLVDPIALLKNIYTMPDEVKKTLWLWISTGMIIGLDGKAYLTPSGSLIINTANIRKSKSIFDFDKIINELEVRGFCTEYRKYIYIPGIMKLTEHASIYLEDGVLSREFVDRLDEYEAMGIDVPILEMHILIPRALILEMYKSVPELYANIVKNLGEYFFSKYQHHIENYRHIPSIVPLVLDVPVDLVIVTERDLVAHKFVNIDKTLHKGISAVMKYVEYGFDKVVLVHYSRDRREKSYYRKVVYSILSKEVIRDVGYVVMYGYDIDRLIVIKVPTFNRGMAQFKYTSSMYRNLIRKHLLILR